MSDTTEHGEQGEARPAVRVSQHGAVGWLVLDRPHARNAITVRLARELEQGLRRLAESARVIVISGAEGNFCAGGDFGEVQRLQAAGPAALRELFDLFGAACRAVGEVAVPVIAAVEGHAMAGGFELMQASDIALAAESAKIADNHSNFGQVPGGGGSQRLPRLVGRQRALAHILTGDRLTGAEAVAWGLAYRCVPAEELADEALRLAQRLAEKEPSALAKAKRLVRDGLGMPLEDGLALETDTVVEHIGGDDAAAAGIERFRGGAGRG